jgi:hypothetical protein
MKRRVYCLAVMESLSPVGSLESFRATLTKNLSNDYCFCLLFRISRKCDIALSLKIFIARTATALFGRCFSTKFCTVSQNRLNCEYVRLSRQTSSTRISKHRSFIKLKLLQNFCSSCKTLADQVARNPRFYCIYLNLGCANYYKPGRNVLSPDVWILHATYFNTSLCY